MIVHVGWISPRKHADVHADVHRSLLPIRLLDAQDDPIVEVERAATYIEGKWHAPGCWSRPMQPLHIPPVPSTRWRQVDVVEAFEVIVEVSRPLMPGRVIRRAGLDGKHLRLAMLCDLQQRDKNRTQCHRLTRQAHKAGAHGRRSEQGGRGGTIAPLRIRCSLSCPHRPQ